MIFKFSQSPVMLTALLFAILSPSIFQVQGLEGRLFYLSFMNISTDKTGPQNGIQEIFISGASYRNGLVKIQYKHPSLNYTEIVSLNTTNNWTYNKTITPQDLGSTLNAQLNVAIVISSQVDISVQANKAEEGTGDGYLALPITPQSKTFYLASYTPFTTMTSAFSIASPYNDTCISVTYVNGSSSYRIMHLTMQENDVYHAGSVDFDYTGVFVSSTEPVAVYSGHSCAMVPVNTLYCDHLIEQVPPVTQWGRSFVMSSFYGRPYPVGYRIRVVAQANVNVTYTYIMFDGSNRPLTPVTLKKVTLARGQWDEATVGWPNATSAIVVMVNCSVDCLVMQYDPSYESFRNGSSETYQPDPFMVTVPAQNHYTNNIRFATSRHYKTGYGYDCVNGITIVSKTTDVDSISVDGIPLSQLAIGTNFTRYDINTDVWSGYSVISGPLNHGFHVVTSNNANAFYTVFVYGHGTKDHTSYGYLGGYGYLYSGDDQPIQSGSPLFDMGLPSQASTPAPASTPLSPGVAGPTDDDGPFYVVQFIAYFYAFNLEGNLRTKFCSEGYARYFQEKRLYAMESKFQQYISSKCAVQGGSITSNLTSFQFSQYTSGEIHIKLKLGGTGSAKFRDIVNCVDGSIQYLTDMRQWVERYNNSREILKNDTDYTRDCNVVHFMPEKFVWTASGWSCPRSVPAAIVSSSSAASISISCTCVSLLLYWMTARLRWTEQ